MLIRVFYLLVFIVSQTYGQFKQTQIVLPTGQRIDTAHIDNMNTIAKKLNSDSSLYYAHKAKDLAHQIGYLKGKADALTIIGNNHVQSKNFDLAIVHFEEAIDIHEKSGNNEGLAISLMDFGALYIKIKDNSTAKIHFEKALNLLKKENKPEFIAPCYNNLGQIAMENDDLDSALIFHRLAEVIYKKNNNLTKIYQTEVFIANTLRKQNKIDEALVVCSKNLENLIQSPDNLVRSETYFLLGQLNFDKENYQLSEKNLLISFQFAKEINDKNLIVNNISNLIKLYEKTNNLEKVSHWKDSLILNANDDFILKNNLFSKNKNEDIFLEYQLLQRRWIIGLALFSLTLLAGAGILAFYFMKLKKFNQIRQDLNTVLINQNQQITEQSENLRHSNQKLQELISVKDKLFSIISHDLKSQLNTTLISLRLLENPELNLKDRLSIITDQKQHTEDTLLLLMNLLTWAKSQLKEYKAISEEFDFNHIVNENFQLFSLQAKSKKIDLINEVPKNAFVYCDYEMINTVVRNLISNSIKYTNEGFIKIKLTENQNHFEVKIEDTGKGISPEILNKIAEGKIINSQIGTNDESGTGLGFNIVNELLRKNNSELKIESTIGKGSIFKFNLLKLES